LHRASALRQFAVSAHQSIREVRFDLRLDARACQAHSVDLRYHGKSSGWVVGDEWCIAQCTIRRCGIAQRSN
jgi:hypothetical protein